MSTSVSEPAEARRAYRFDGFVLDLERESLTRDGRELRLRPKSFAVLSYLVRNGGRLVTKGELLDAIWGHRHVTEGSLTQCLIDIRRALGDEAHEIVRTVPRRGFIFEPDVTAEPPVSDREAPRRRPARRRHAAIGAAAVALILIGGWWGAGFPGLRAAAPRGIVPPAPSYSIAVLPFVDMSESGDNQYFADGLSEEVLNSLTQVRGLAVIARTSSFAFKGRNVDIPTVAQKLKVTHVLEGSVRKSGDMVRITVQLVDARSDTHVWSRTFDRELGDVFGVQSEIARLVAETLKISRSRKSDSTAVSPPDPEAYEHYLRGKYFWHRRGDGDRDLAEREFRRATELDPAFAPAWAALAGAYFARNMQERPPETGWLSRFHEMLERALAADPDLAEAHARLASYFAARGDRKSAEKQWARAQALKPDSVPVLSMGAGWALQRGLYGEAVALQRRATELDPLSAVMHGNLGGYLLASGRFEEAASELRQCLELRQNSGNGTRELRDLTDTLVLIRILRQRYEEALAMLSGQRESPAMDENLALANWALGRKDQYKEAAARMSHEDDWRMQFRAAEISAFRGEIDRAFEQLHALNSGFDPDSADPETADYIFALRLSPLFIPLRDDPRWQQLWSKWHEWM